MNISVTVMAHPKRKAAAEALLEQLQQYPFCHADITYDEINEEWHTGERSLRKGIGHSGWHLVIQDDAILTPNFYENLEGAIQNVPLRVLISLYTGTGTPLPSRVSAAVQKAGNATWLTHYHLCWGVALLIPSDHIEPLLDFVSEPPYNNDPYDLRIGIFYYRNRLPIYYTMPSLVDHDDDKGSLLDHGKHGKRRVAHKLATGPIKWNQKVIDI